MMKKTVAIILLILGVFTGTASAVEVTVFGPNRYVRTSGAPDVFTNTFIAYPGAGTLIVKNGSQVGENRIMDAISSAEIFVNGEQILGPSDFNQNVYLIEAPINLLANNSITVMLASKPESYITVEVIEDVAPPTVTINADPGSIFIDESSTLTWQSANSDSCSIAPEIGPVDLYGETSVSPGKTTTYTITATGLGGTATSTVTVSVLHPPEVEIYADPQTILSGESSTLSWTSTYADEATIDQGIGSVTVNGSINVSPTDTTTYTITVTGPGGTASVLTTLTVEQPSGLPTVTLSATPPVIEQGGTATLSWDSNNADSAHIDNGIGGVNPEGVVAVSPAHTTTYTITVIGEFGAANASVTVKVAGGPEPLPEGSFGEQYADLIPPDATIEYYDSKRFSLITGIVHDLSDAPILGVSVSIHGYPEYGTVLTDAQGQFSIPVEGGSTMTVDYRKDGLINTHRKIYVPWNDTAITETIQMIAEDSISTTLTFDGNPDKVVTHQSTQVTDEFGSRSASMVFTGDNRAFLVDENGNDLQELSTITTRATEYTTPESMPAKLPPNSAYTYCVELSVDGAQRVRFEKPVVGWVDNFLGFDVGMAVPVGYYDRDKGVWVPSDNGVVVKLLDTNVDGIVDALDADGDDQPDDLDNNGSFSNEVQGLEDPTQYAPDTTYWRATITHFTPWDWNWPYVPPEDAIAPNAEGVAELDDQCEGDCEGLFSSYIEARSRIFHEDISIAGTDLNLHYASNRVEGYKSIITVPVSGNTVPASLKRIIVKLEVAGRSFNQIMEPIPNQIAEFIWDGTDQLGRPLLSPINARVSVGFVYDAVYANPSEFAQAFGQAGRGGTGRTARDVAILWRKKDLTIYSVETKSKNKIAEGWSLSRHHLLSLVNASVLYKGDGSKTYNYSGIIETVAGNPWGNGGDGGPAIDAQLNLPRGVALDATGNLYIADHFNSRIRKVDTSGIITTVAGNGMKDYSGDGGPATAASLSYPNGIAFDAAGNLYIADTYNNRIRKVDTSGIITTIAGNGVYDYSGDGGPATEAQLKGPFGIALDAAGNLYIADTNNSRIRKVDTSGIITTIAGNGVYGYSGDGGPAIDAQISIPAGVAVDAAGNLYIADYGNSSIRKVDTGGLITTVAGNGLVGYSGDGGPATEAQLKGPIGVALDAAGNLYIADYADNRIRKVDTSGIITTAAGSGGYGYSGDGGPATSANFYLPFDVALDAAGHLYIADSYSLRIRRVSPASEYRDTLTAGEISFFEDTGLGHVFSSSGMHETTFDSDSGVVLRSFSYDEDNNLDSIIDQFGNTISIERDSIRGVPVAIISPDGVRTELTIDSNNHLTGILYPDGSAYSFEYTPDGLMTAEIDPEGNRFEHDFDFIGRLTDVYDEEDGHWYYQRAVFENGNVMTQVTSGEGNMTSYLDHTASTGEYNSTITDPTGANTFFSRSADGLTVNKSPSCGMDLEYKYDLDSEYKFKYVKESSESTPSGLERVMLRDKVYEDTDFDEIPDLITETVTVNGKTTTLEHNTLQAQKTIISPEGRSATSLYDPNTLLTESVGVPGLYDTIYGYDSRGRLISISTDIRQSTFAYNAEGFLESVTDPENHTTFYSYDPVGRVIAIDRPDGGSVGFTYDKNGNMTMLTNPVDVGHGFGFNKVNRNSSYQTPLSGSYSYIYDKDRRLIQTNFPSGKSIINDYADPSNPNNKSRLWQIRTPEGNIDITYLCGTKVDSISKGEESITYGYDGQLLTSEIQGGTLNQTLGYSYNNDFDISNFTYAGHTENYIYDKDGLLIGSGDFSITRNAGNGLPEVVSDGVLNVARTFNGYGEVAEQNFLIGGQDAISWALSVDNNGRIVSKTETAGGVTASYEYTYDSMGRLLTVTKDGNLVEEYSYDHSGTRVSETNTLRGISGRDFSYSDEDHLLTAGPVTYSYDLDGFLTGKTNGAEVTTYSYSSRGELLNVTLPDGRVIEYLHDPLGRRIAKIIDGAIVEKYLWQGLTRLLAVYDGSDNLKMRFEYTDSRTPLTMTSGGTTYYLTYDQVGSLRVVAESTGNMVKLLAYDSFGNIIDDTNPAFVMPFGFAGGLYDPDTELVRFGYRDYDPNVGRWTAKDPILFAGGDTDLYGYVLNNPNNFVDPTGELIGIGTVIVVGAVAIFGGYTLWAVYQDAVSGAEELSEANEKQQEYIDNLTEGLRDLKMPDDKEMSELGKACSIHRQKGYLHGGRAAARARTLPGTAAGGPLSTP